MMLISIDGSQMISTSNILSFGFYLFSVPYFALRFFRSFFLAPFLVHLYILPSTRFSIPTKPFYLASMMRIFFQFGGISIKFENNNRKKCISIAIVCLCLCILVGRAEASIIAPFFLCRFDCNCLFSHVDIRCSSLLYSIVEHRQNECLLFVLNKQNYSKPIFHRGSTVIKV